MKSMELPGSRGSFRGLELLYRSLKADENATEQRNSILLFDVGEFCFLSNT